MAEIINHNAQDNPRLSQIYEILLLAGYFRIRIASLKAFDKVIGGIAWCITSSNFQIQVQYNDQMQIGQKIKVSEHICNALVNMKCPYVLQPFQLQGLDVNNIFPVVQWLVKFVYETRFERQKYNREISVLLGKDILKLQNKGNSDKIPLTKPIRKRINKQISQMKHDHPIRIYSALLQFQDATALKMYHKLQNIITNKLGKEKDKKKGQKINKENKDKSDNDIMAYLQTQDENINQADLKNFGQVGKFSLAKLEKIISQNRQKLEEAIKQHEEQEHLIVNLDKGKGGSNQQVQNIVEDIVEMPKFSKQSIQEKQIKAVKIQNDKYDAQIKALRIQLQNLVTIQTQVNDQKQVLIKKRKTVENNFTQVQTNYAEIQEIGNQIETQLSQKKSNAKIQKLVQKKLTLKQKKAEVKRKAKAKLEELQQERSRIETSIPQIDEEAFKHMLEEAQLKKEIYDKKYQQLTKVNQQLAILQRKAENYTSVAQIAQYHQKFIQLFEAINCLIQQKRSMFNQVTNLESIRKVISNYQQFLNNAKDGVVSARKKNEKRQLADNIKEIMNGFEGNMKNAKITFQKMKSSRQASYSSYIQLIKLERYYLKILRNFKIEYENVQKLYR